MYVRLAFAVAAHLLADILIVDEVLAVGDAEFQKKCLGKMKDVSAGEGRTVLFVSHNMAAVKNLCSKSIFMEEGRLSCEGETSYVIKTYCNKYLSNKQTKYWIRDNQDTNNQVCFKEVRIALKGNQPHLILEIYFNLVFSKNAAPAFVAFDIKNSAGVTLMQAIPKLEPFVKYSEDSYEYICNIDLVGIIPDSYFVSCWIGAHYTVTYDYLEDIVSFEVLTGPMTGRTFPYAVEHGNLIPNSKIYKLHEKYN
jgi:lipopolysaccharide transport system ATP-binding protein